MAKKTTKKDPRRTPKPGSRRNPTAAKKKTAKKVVKKAASKKKTVKKTVKKAKRGGQTKYLVKFAAIASDSIVLGHTNKTTFKLLGVSEATFYKWMHDYDDFNAAVNTAKETLILDKIKKTNIRCCLGYRYTETTMQPAIRVIMDELGADEVIDSKQLKELMEALGADKDGMIVTKKVRKHKHPDAGLIKHYLHNKSHGEFVQGEKIELEAGKSLIDIMAKVGINASH